MRSRLSTTMERVHQSHPTPPLPCRRESPKPSTTTSAWTPAANGLLTPHDRSVIWKLMSFTFAMITLPIGTYFFTVNWVFQG